MFNKKLKKLEQEKKLTEIANSLLQGRVEWLKIENEILRNQLKMCALDLDIQERLILGLANKKSRVRQNPFLEID